MKRSLLILISCFLSVSCASHYGSAKIISNPAGAEVVDGKTGKVLGVTPTSTWWKDSGGEQKFLLLHFKKDGYYTASKSFWLSMRHKSLESANKNQQLLETTLQKQGN